VRTTPLSASAAISYHSCPGWRGSRRMLPEQSEQRSRAAQLPDIFTGEPTLLIGPSVDCSSVIDHILAMSWGSANASAMC